MADNPYTYQDSDDTAYNEDLQVTITPNSQTPDLSLITSATIEVRSRNGVVPTSPVLWTASLSGQTTTALRLNYTFVDGDRATAGPYFLLIRLFISPSTIPIRMVPHKITILPV